MEPFITFLIQYNVYSLLIGGWIASILSPLMLAQMSNKTSKLFFASATSITLSVAAIMSLIYLPMWDAVVYLTIVGWTGVQSYKGFPGVQKLVYKFFSTKWVLALFNKFGTRVKTLLHIVDWTSRSFNYALFVGVAGGVYYWLSREKEEKPKQFESIRDRLSTEGITGKTIFELMSYGVKVGSIVAGICDIGFALTPRDYAYESVISDLLKMISNLWPNSTSQKQEQDAIDKQGLGFGDPSDTIIGRLSDVAKEFRQIVYKHRARLSIVAIAALVGTLLFVYRHCPGFFISWSKQKLTGFYHKINGRWVKVTPEDAIMLDYEGKGKNKSGRGARKHGRKTERPAKKAKNYIVYDEDDIREIFFKISIDDSEEVPMGRPQDIFGKPLKSGYYIIVRDDGYGGYFEEHIDNVRSDDRGYEAIVYLDHITYEDTTSTVVDDDAVVTTRDKRKKVISSAQKVSIEVPKPMPEPKHEAIVHSSPMFKTDNIMQAVGVLLNDKKEKLQNCIGTSAGILANAHSAQAAKYVDFGGKVFELDGGVVSKYHDDLYIFNRIHGAPALNTRKFESPVKGMAVTIISKCNLNAHASGQVSKVEKTEATVTMSTEEGFCGSPYINSNGKIVGIHSRKGVDGRDNVGICCGDEFMKSLKWETHEPKLKN